MEGDRQVHFNPYNDWRVPAGRDAFAKLFDTEVYFMAETHSQEPPYKLFRRSAVKFIAQNVKQTRSMNFDALIPYTAMTYVDRFLLNRQIPRVVDSYDKNANLFLICCLIMAWKIRTKNFGLPSFLEERNLEYTAQNVLAMELLICRNLDWRMRTVTPFRFVEFFVPFDPLPPDLPSPIPLRSVRQLIIRSQSDIAFTGFRPSVLAASAMLTVSSKRFPNHLKLFETHIVNSEFIKPLKDMVFKCHEMLVPLYRDPPSPGEDPGSAETKPAEPKAATGEASGSVVRKQSDPIPIPGRGTPTAAQTEISPKFMSEALFEASILPGENVEEALHRFRQEKQAFEEERALRKGKGKMPTESEIRPQIEASHGLVRVDSDELTNFELGWIEAQADADKSDVGLAGSHADMLDVSPFGSPTDMSDVSSAADLGTYIVENLAGCCGCNRQGCCHIL